MRSLKLRGRQALGGALWRAGRQAPRPGTLTVLMYHAVTREPIDDSGQLSVSADRFARQMAEIGASGVEVVDLADGAARLRRRGLDRAAAAIVFDDGFVGVHEHAADILGRHAFPSTVFLTTSWMGQAAMPLADSRLGRPLTWSEVQALDRGGMTIGSHTDSHPRLAALTEEGIGHEVRRSREAIADRLGRAPETFAYPFGSFGSFDARTRASLAEYGFRVGCTTVAGRNDGAVDPLALKRIRVSWCDGDGEIRKALAGCYDWYRWVQRMQSLNLTARS